VKKKNQVNEDVFKRVSSPKETREFTISERVTKANPHQHNTDFVASQQRVYSTKGKESELAKGSEVSPEEVGRSAANPNASSSNLSKTKIRKIEAAKRAQLEAAKRVQKPTLTASVIPPTADTDPALPQAHMDTQQTTGADAVALSGEKQRGNQTSQADMGHQRSKPASEASLTGRGENPSASYADSTQAADGVPLVDLGDSPNHDFGKTLLPDRLDGRQPSGEGLVGLPGEQLPHSTGNPTASQADMGHHASANAGAANLGGHLVDQAAGQADLGLHISANAGAASLDGHLVDQAAGQADLGPQFGTNAGKASLDPNALDPKVGEADMGLHVDANAGKVSLDPNALDPKVGEADMGLHVDANAGKASLDPNALDPKVGEADMGVHVGANAGKASLDPNALDPKGGEADMGLHVGANAGEARLDPNALDLKVGDADMGLHVGANAGKPRLEGNTSDPMAVQADMGHQESKKSSQVFLTGRHREAPVSSVSMSPTSASEASEADVGDTSSGAGNNAVVSPSRLAEKMSKIRSKTDDITTESEVLQNSNNKP